MVNVMQICLTKMTKMVWIYTKDDNWDASGPSFTTYVTGSPIIIIVVSVKRIIAPVETVQL